MQANVQGFFYSSLLLFGIRFLTEVEGPARQPAHSSWNDRLQISTVDRWDSTRDFALLCLLCKACELCRLENVFATFGCKSPITGLHDHNFYKYIIQIYMFKFF